MSAPDVAVPFASRVYGMSASEVRALFAVAARPEVISLAGGMPFVQALPQDEVLGVVQRVLTMRADVALQYGGGGGQLALRRRLVSVMATQGLEARPEDVLVTVGAQQALDLVAKLMIDPGGLVAVEAPSYVGALSAFSVFEPRFLEIPMDEEGLIPERLERALEDGARPRFLYTCPNFHNPAGVTLSHSRRVRLVEICRSAQITIVEDDPYGMLRFDGKPLETLRSLDPENVIYLGTLSKIFCPGIRVGWVVAEPEIVERLTLFKEAADLCSSNLSQLVAEEWLEDEARWRGSVKDLTSVYRSRRDAMLGAIEELLPAGTRWTVPRGGFYVWVTLPEDIDASALLPSAVENGVAYVPGTAFYAGGRGRNQLRLAYCYVDEEQIRAGVERLAPVLAGARSPA